ncbi:hypothetical protein EJ02DRAFT_382878 [Clathrospora elynae]|uniref:Xylanolytic transcriptional activator regulatory domain-containing protein n=1 Tax=Clathrospora elynae TaxID=706981 RepID=A0A6A5SE25_9PLEO|nr:hypothetical protein EJ02DRAFT_382878 [Clathrospora elynae]
MDRECVYILARKDRLVIATERCLQMEALLREMRARASVEEKRRINDLLGVIENDVSESKQTPISSTFDTGPPESRGKRKLDEINHFKRPRTETLDLPDDDLPGDDLPGDDLPGDDLPGDDLPGDEEARSTGVVENASEVQWLRTVALAQTDQVDLILTGLTPQQRLLDVSGGSEGGFDVYSFWADHDKVDTDYFVDPYEIPPQEVAERLIKTYLLEIHDTFPILPRRNFEDQARVYFTAQRRGNAPLPSPQWQATLNLVFAIAANYSHLVDGGWQADDHIQYQMKARAFSLSEAAITSQPDVPHIRSLGLLAFYYLSTGHVGRAWTIVGMALRSAYDLDLHVHNKDSFATAARRESLTRTWWCLYSLERTLSIITGRPSIVVDASCSAPLPHPAAEEDLSEGIETAYGTHRAPLHSASSCTFPISSTVVIDPVLTPTRFATSYHTNPDSYFRTVIQLSLITTNILTSIYPPTGTTPRSAAETQQDTARLAQRLDQWASSLPTEYNYQNPTLHAPNATFSRERMILRFQLCSAKILLTRPYLSARRKSGKDAKEAASFAGRMADLCIDAARTMIGALPDEACPDFIYRRGPWWCIVHYMMQAVSVLLLGLCYPFSTSQDVMTTVQCVEKALRWLQGMRGPVAERAHSISQRLFRGVARQYGVTVAE